MAGQEHAAGIGTDEFIRIGNDGRKWIARDKGTDTADFYSWMVDCRRLLLTKDELTWLERQTVPDREVDVFVNMSCGTQLIPHVTLEIVDVLRALGVSFVAGTGPQFCCGKPFRTRDRQDAGVKVSQASLDRFMSWGATTATHVCQSCQIIYSNHVAERESAAPGLVNVHLTEFIENRIRELGDDVPWKRAPGLRTLTANCHAMSPVHKASHASVERIMELIPGVEVVGKISSSSRGAPCTTDYPGGPSILAELDDRERAEVTRDLESQARAAGDADTIVMHAHWCQREWQKFSSERLGVKHFVSVLAEALDCSHPNRYDQFWKLGDPEAVVEQSRPYWESWGMTPAQARDIAYKNFHPHYSGFLNTDCACGGDPAKCNTGKNTLLNG
ncbi:MAG: heterodisulfide reductase-related iron-sulfur binding cluster [Kribbellaceae bacterium]